MKKSTSRLAAIESQDGSEGVGVRWPAASARIEMSDVERKRLWYDASSGEVQMQLRHSCFVHVLQGG